MIECAFFRNEDNSHEEAKQEVRELRIQEEHVRDYLRVLPVDHPEYEEFGAATAGPPSFRGVPRAVRWRTADGGVGALVGGGASLLSGQATGWVTVGRRRGCQSRDCDDVETNT